MCPDEPAADHAEDSLDGKRAGELRMDYGFARQRVVDLEKQLEVYNQVAKLKPFQMKQVADIYRQKSRAYKRLADVSFAYGRALEREADL